MLLSKERNKRKIQEIKDTVGITRFNQFFSGRNYGNWGIPKELKYLFNEPTEISKIRITRELIDNGFSYTNYYKEGYDTYVIFSGEFITWYVYKVFPNGVVCGDFTTATHNIIRQVDYNEVLHSTVFIITRKHKEM